MTSLLNVKDNSNRGDFCFRDVFRRNTYSSFTGNTYADDSSIYIDANAQKFDCTSLISRIENNLGSLHLFTRNNGNFNRDNVAQATVSIDALSTTFRSANVHCKGGFTVSANLFHVSPQTARVGVSTLTPQYTLDVNGDCNLASGSTYRINGVPILSATNMTVGSVTANGNIVQNSGTAQLQEVVVQGNLTVNGATWASSVMYETTTPFLFAGPGPAYSNGVPFFGLTKTNGTAFVTASGTSNHIFTFSTAGTYMLQAELEVGYPWMTEGDITTFYTLNGNANVKFGKESHAPSNFSCTRPYLLSVHAGDNVRFILDSSSGNEYEVGLNTARLTLLKLA